MSKVIPKEQLTAYQRWELAQFEETGSPHAREPGRAAQVALPTAEEIERLHQEAWRQGHELGLEEGRKAGFSEGMQAAGEKLKLLAGLIETLDAARLRQDEEIAREVLALALTVAQQVVRRAIQVRPELLLDALRDALLSLPALNGHQKIAVHPEHVELVREWLLHEHGHLSWKVLADPKLEPGSFRFESSHSELDGSLRARWREITECLGVDDDSWLS